VSFQQVGAIVPDEDFGGLKGCRISGIPSVKTKLKCFYLVPLTGQGFLALGVVLACYNFSPIFFGET
jgi:hypothetical protein